jgi:hypothetical protein
MAIFDGFFDNFLHGATNPKGNLGDYEHAARLYTDNNMRLTPKLKHLYHVVFNINPRIKSLLGTQNVFDKTEINLLVKSIDLPGYSIKTETVNQYNRKKVVQTGVEYNPVNLEFHDDNAGITTFLWESYFRYYYADSNYTNRNSDGSPGKTSTAYQKTTRNPKTPTGSLSLNSMYGGANSLAYKYGLDRGGKPEHFFTSIQVFQLHPQNVKPTFTSFTLINPIISKFQHDKLAQDGSEFTMNTMTIEYEAVFYNRGNTKAGSIPANFATTHYDHMPSPLTLAGGTGTGTLFGTGGVLSGINTVLDDLTNGNFLGGIIVAANTFKEAKHLTLKSVGGEVINSISPINLSKPGALNDVVFPRTLSNTDQVNASQVNFK